MSYRYLFFDLLSSLNNIQLKIKLIHTMKKLFAFILLLASLSVGCLIPTMGAFAMSSVDSAMQHQGMDHDMSWHMWMDTSSEDDSGNMHECCEAPMDWLTPVVVSQDDWDLQDDDSQVLYANYESLFNNSIDRLNSPPIPQISLNHNLKNAYTSLVGIIKNNN